jgi:hypothetical protein
VADKGGWWEYYKGAIMFLITTLVLSYVLTMSSCGRAWLLDHGGM